MKPDQFKAIIDKLKAACAKEPTPAQYDVLIESIADNRLTDEEIMRGYRASRDAAEPWWPKPGEFLARARPPVSAPVIAGEAETLFRLILDHPLKYGTYNPETGTVWDRRKIEAAHGRAAGEAFGSVQGRFRTMETLADEKWVRKAFCDAYAESRIDHGAPSTLTPPERCLTAQEPRAALPGATAETEAQKRFNEILNGSVGTSFLPENFEERKAILLKQAEAMREAKLAEQAKELTR